MDRSRASSQLPKILDTLSLSEADHATRQLVDAFGGEPVAVKERPVGEPARQSRRLLFSSGGEVILHDDTVAAVLLHLRPTLTAPRGLDLSTWIEGVDNDATLDDLAEAIGGTPKFAGIGSPYSSLGGGHVRPNFKDNRGWKHAGDLVSLTFTVERPESQLTCKTCSRIIWFTLLRDSRTIFGYYIMNDAMRRPLEPIPPVERWGGPARIAEANHAMHDVDHEPAVWFLVEQDDRLTMAVVMRHDIGG